MNFELWSTPLPQNKPPKKAHDRKQYFKEYNHSLERKQYLKEYMAKPEVRKHRREYQKEWRSKNPELVKEIVKKSYEKRKKNQKGLKERTRNNN